MARNPWDEDPELKAMRASMKPERGSTRWGGLLFGIVLVACGTFAFGYYVPLYRAHQTLASGHGRIMSQVETLEKNLQTVQADLKAESEKRAALEAEKEKREDVEKSKTQALGKVKSAVEAGIEKTIAKKQAAVGVDGGKLLIGLSQSALFSSAKLDVTSSGKSVLCDVAKAAGARPIRVRGVSDDKGLPALIKVKYSNAWTASAAAAASVAETLEDKCDVDAKKLTLAGIADGRAPSSVLAAAKLGGLRVELEISDAAP